LLKFSAVPPEIVGSNQAVCGTFRGDDLSKLIRASVAFRFVAFRARDAQISGHVCPASSERLFMVYMPLSGAGQFLAPVAQYHWGMDRPKINLTKRSTPADPASQSFSPRTRPTRQVALGKNSVILAVLLPATRICDFTVSDGPFRLILWKRIALFPCQLARFGVRLLLFNGGNTGRLLRARFGVIAKEQPLKT